MKRLVGPRGAHALLQVSGEALGPVSPVGSGQRGGPGKAVVGP
jgi:hypothetical protein